MFLRGVSISCPLFLRGGGGLSREWGSLSWGGGALKNSFINMTLCVNNANELCKVIDSGQFLVYGLAHEVRCCHVNEM